VTVVTPIEQFAVHAATPEDKQALLSFAIMIKTEDALQEVSNDKMEVLVDRCIRRDCGIAGVVRGSLGIEASIGLTIEELDYSDEKHVSVRWLGVHPARRKTDNSARLMGFATRFQEGLGIPLFMEVTTTNALEGKLRWFSRHAPQVGALFSLGKLPKGAFTQISTPRDKILADARAEKLVRYIEEHPYDARFRSGDGEKPLRLNHAR
jgi:hypothetical protein